MRIQTDAGKCRHKGCRKFVLTRSGYCEEHEKKEPKQRRCSVCKDFFTPKASYSRRCDKCVASGKKGNMYE